MSIKNSSIFNEVFGPIMIGPSSSHTAGPARIGLSTRLMLPDPPARIRIIFDRRGAYPPTYQGQGADYGYMGGLLGLETGDERLRRSLKTASDEGIDYQFIIGDLDDTWHPNCVRIEVTSQQGYNLVVEGASTGGGTFKLTGYQGYPIDIEGGSHEFLIEVTDPAEAEKRAKEIMGRTGIDFETHVSGSDGKFLINIRSDQKPDCLLDELEKAFGRVVYLRPVMPVVKRMASVEPFLNAAEALEYAEAHGIRETWKLAAIYESSLSGSDEKEVLAMMGVFAAAMRKSAHQSLAGGYGRRGFIGPQLPGMQKKIDEGSVPQFNMGVLNRAVMWGCGIFDFLLSGGLAVAAPTGGSGGVLPGAIISVGEEMGKSEDEINRALLVGGLVGVFVNHQATFAAEAAACQAEIGSASAMAAAGAVQLLGGTPEESFKAAALALINLLGLICDPVGGIGNIPCVNRNATGVVNAIASANMVMAGFDPCIPLDEVIQTMMSVGNLLPSCLRCTGDGGLCATPTAHKLRAMVTL